MKQYYALTRHPAAPDYELEGWRISLDEPPEAVIRHYKAHATPEQFHIEIKTDLDLVRLPFGKFATKDLILHLAQLAYNILRLMGQLGMTWELSPVRHPPKRRRLRAVLQELAHRAAVVIHKARQIILDFGQDIGRITVLNTHSQPTALPARIAMLIACWRAPTDEKRGATTGGRVDRVWLVAVRSKRTIWTDRHGNFW